MKNKCRVKMIRVETQHVSEFLQMEWRWIHLRLADVAAGLAASLHMSLKANQKNII